MVQRIINDIEGALEHDCFLSALSLALTLPDICGKAEFPNERTGERYKKWYDKYRGNWEATHGEKHSMPYISGEVIYSLRCLFLHEGSPNIQKEKIKNQRCKIDHFTLVVEKKKEVNSYCDVASVNSQYEGGEKIGVVNRGYEVNVRRLCRILTSTALAYYQANPDKFDFFSFDIVDMDERWS